MTTTRLELPGPGEASGTGVIAVALTRPTERALRAASSEQAFEIVLAAVQATLYRYLDQDEITVSIARDALAAARPVTTVVTPATSFAVLRATLRSAEDAPDAGDAGAPANTSNVVCSRWCDDRAPDASGEILHIGVQDTQARALAIAYDRSRFAHVAVVRLAAHLGRLLDDALARPDAAIDQLMLLGADDLAELDRLGLRELELGPPATIHALFEAQVRRAPTRIAAACDREELSYEALDRRASAIASALADARVVPGDVVAIELARSCDLLAAILGVLKAGAAFLMIDPEHPAERRALLVRRSGARVMIARGAGAGDLAAARIDVAELADLPSGGVPGVAVAPGAPAYVVFTSGSTGEPKAVVVGHDAFVNRMRWLARAYQLGPDDVSLAKSPLSFDPAICEMLRVLPLGGRVGLLAHGGERDPACVVAAIARHRATIIDLVPSPLAALLDHVAAHGASDQLASLRFVLAGAENLPPALVREFQQLVHAPHGTRLINTWGATETTVDVTWLDCTAMPPGERVPVGTPIANTELRVLGRAGQLMPIGMVGELYVGGIAVAAGYLDDPVATARQFVRIAALGGGRYYRSGDAVRWRSDGNLEFLRRFDEQLKIRGVRIEPGEIAAVLESHPQVARALVRGTTPDDGEPLLLAYAVPRAPAPTEDELRSWLRARLPAMLVPDHVFVLERLATNSSEKIDLRALPVPRRGQSALAPPPAGHTGDVIERTIAEIWSEVVGGAPPDPRDDFFACGGHSLAAARLTSRVYRRLGVALAVRDVFAHPTLAQLAGCVRDRAPTGALAAIPSAPRSARPRASHAQRRIWLSSQHAQASRAYNIPVTLEISAGLDRDRLQRALDSAIARHEILRTSFSVEGGELVQVIRPAQDSRVIVAQRAAADAAHAEPQLRELHGAAFDLAHGPLLRCAVLALGDGGTLLALTLHHLIADAWSIGILVRELLTATTERELDAPAPAVQYRDYAAWHDALLAGPIGLAQQQFWRTELAGELPVLELPTDYPRPAARNYQGRNHSFLVEPGLTTRLAELARGHGASLFMVLLAGWTALLHRYSRQPEFVIGTPVAGRDHPDLEDQLGCFVNSLPLRVRCDGGAAMTALLASVRATCLGAFEHQTYPFDRMVIDLAPPRRADRSPIFDVMLVLQNAPDRGRGALGEAVAVREVELDLTLGKLDLIVTFTETGGRGLAASIQYDTALFAPSTIERMARHLVAVLAAAVVDPSAPVASYPLGEALPELGAPAAHGATSPALLHHLFAAQAERTPDRIAVRAGTRALTYRALDHAARRLAAHLRARGIGRGHIVAFLLDRSERLAVTELAILMAGAAFLPIDHDYPAQRVSLILEDARPALVIVDRRSAAEQRQLGGPAMLCLDDLDLENGELAPVAAGEPEDAAYVIFTSGSSGRPKGVVVEHRSIVSLATIDDWLFDFSASDTWSLFHSIGFDFSVWELWIPLTRGACVVVVPSAALRDPARLASLVVEEGVTVLCQVPSAFDALARELLDRRAPLALRWVIFGGEPVNAVHLAALRAAHPGLRCVNGYGITETTIFSSFHLLTGAADDHHNIGRALSNQQLYVRDDDGAAVPDGLTGELWITGTGVARGYLARPELTAERFRSAPELPGGRCYRSGDLVRRGPTGELIFVGRKDSQIKLRGFRIEVEEIRAAIAQTGLAHDSAVLDDVDAGGDRILVGYLLGSPALDTEELRRRLLGTLPHYMVPSQFVVLDEFPYGSTGKLDRRALAERRRTAHARAASAPPPAASTEQQLLALWHELLDRSDLSTTDDFFAVGGHSLKAVQLIVRIRERFGVAIDIAELFARPTIASLARVLDAAAPAAPAHEIVALPAEADYPLSAIQHQFWMLEQFRAPGEGNHTPEIEVITGELHRDAAAAALAELFARFEILRTRFVVIGREPRCVIDPPGDGAGALRWTDATSAGEPDRVVQAIYDAACEEPFELARGGLLRLHVIQRGPRDFVALWSAHHIVSDGWSLVALARAWRERHDAHRAGAPARLPAPRIQYKDVAAWHERYLASAAGQAQIAEWAERLAGLPALALPGDRGGRCSFRARVCELVLDRAIAAGLLRACQDRQATLFMGLSALIKAALYLHLGGRVDDLALGAPIANRIAPEIEDQPGPFLNVVVLRDRITTGDTLCTLIDQIKATAQWAYARPLIPVDRIAAQLGWRRDQPLFDIGLTLQNQSRSTGTTGIRAAERFFGLTTAIWLDACEDHDGVRIAISYDEARFQPASIEALRDRLARTAAFVTRFPSTPITHALNSPSRHNDSTIRIELDV